LEREDFRPEPQSENLPIFLSSSSFGIALILFTAASSCGAHDHPPAVADADGFKVFMVVALARVALFGDLILIGRLLSV